MSAQAHDSLFCDLCGTLLSFQSNSYASCMLCKSTYDINEFEGKEIRFTITSEDLVRTLGIEPLVPLDGQTKNAGEEVAQKAEVNEECPKCHHPKLEYYARQLRSADEGQTVFYECPNPKCRHKFSLNT